MEFKFSLYIRIKKIPNDDLHVYIEYKEQPFQTVNTRIGPIPIILVDEILYELKQTLKSGIKNTYNNLFETFK